MKRLLLLLLILVLPASSWAAIAEVGAGSQRKTGTATNGVSAPVVFTNVTAGNFLVCTGGAWNTGAGFTTVSVAKTAGAGSIGAVSTILGATGVTYAGGTGKAFLSYANITGTGALTMTVSTDVGTGNYINAVCDEFSGTSITLDVNGGEATSTSATPTDTITTLTANALIVGTIVVGSGAITAVTEGAGYTAFGEDENPTIQIYGAEFRIAGAATSYNVNWTLGSSFPVSIVNAAFKEVTGDTTPPTVPTNLTTTATGSDRLSHAWGASTDDSLGVPTYRLERAPFSGACGAYTEIAQPTTNAYLDTGLTASTTYCYRVRATDATGNLSGYSNVTQTATLAVRSLTLFWDDNSPNAQNPTTETGFQIERCTGAACSDFALLATVGQNVTTYVDAVSPNPIAGYRVTALPSGGGYSNIVYSTPVLNSILSTFPPSLSFAAAPGSNPVSQSIAISKNVGGPAMAWTVTDDATWLTVTPSSGTDNALVTASVNTTGLTAGVYTATITVTAPGATGSPQAIPVTLTMSVANSGSGGRIR